jgi:hypothetical protein
MKKVSNANPQQASYVMGKSELIEYVNADGKKLRAMLTKPENFDPEQEVSADGLHLRGADAGAAQLRAPNVGTSINIPRYVSNGYVVLRPDIVYETGYPGQSAEKCVIPAVNTVLAMGFIDPKRIGIQGHSWGGYQITYLVTRTNMFAGGRGRRLGLEHDQRLRRHPLGHRHVARVPVREDAVAHRRAAVGRAAAVHRELADLLGQEGADAVPHDPQRRGRRGAVVPGHRVVQRDAPPRQGGLHVHLQR